MPSSPLHKLDAEPAAASKRPSISGRGVLGAVRTLNRDPDVFARVESIGPSGKLDLLTAFGVLALLLHGSLGVFTANSPLEIRAFAAKASTLANARVLAKVDIEVEKEEETTPPPEPEPEPTPAPAEQAPPPEAALPQDIPPSAAAPAAAQAGQVLTAAADPNAPLDLSDQGFLSGTGDRFAGGYSAADGRATIAVRSAAARADGVVGGTGKAPAAPVQDLSKPATLSLSSKWDCPFPAEADAEQVNQAVVRIVVNVGPDGKPISATPLSDPGYGFAKAAVRCAMRETYVAGQDQAGKPVARTTAPFRVRFTR